MPLFFLFLISPLREKNGSFLEVDVSWKAVHTLLLMLVKVFLRVENDHWVASFDLDGSNTITEISILVNSIVVNSLSEQCFSPE